MKFGTDIHGPSDGFGDLLTSSSATIRGPLGFV